MPEIICMFIDCKYNIKRYCDKEDVDITPTPIINVLGEEIDIPICNSC